MNKVKKCKDCKEVFEPFKPAQPRCVPCALDKAKKDTERLVKRQAAKRKQETRQRKAKLKTRSEWLRDAQATFNAFIRDRDKLDPCISCGRFHEGQYHAGHYRTVGANPELRFNENNCHKQCSACNNHLSGNITNYRINLVKKIGIEAVEILEGPHEITKLTIEDIKEIKECYKAKIKALKHAIS